MNFSEKNINNLIWQNMARCSMCGRGRDWDIFKCSKFVFLFKSTLGRNAAIYQDLQAEMRENITLDKQQDNSQTEVSNGDKRPWQKKLLQWR